MGCLKFVKISTPGFMECLDVVGLHVAWIERLFADLADAFSGTPQGHAPPH